MMVETFPLPGSSFKILRLILIGYLHQGGSERKAAGPTEIGAATGMDTTIVSRNNAFLAGIGLLENEGRKWRLTEGGVPVARALEYDADEEIRSTLSELLRSNAFVTKITTFLRGRGGVEAAQLAEHIARTAGAPKKSASLTGARTIIEMLVRSGILREDGGVFDLARAPRETRSVGGAVEATEESRSPGSLTVTFPVDASIVINLSLSSDDLESDEAADALATRIRRLVDSLRG